MLAKDVFAVNDLDEQIQALIRQLNELMEERMEITSGTYHAVRKIGNAIGIGSVDLNSLDMDIEPSAGLSLHHHPDSANTSAS